MIRNSVGTIRNSMCEYPQKDTTTHSQKRNPLGCDTMKNTSLFCFSFGQCQKRKPSADPTECRWVKRHACSRGSRGHGVVPPNRQLSLVVVSSQSRASIRRRRACYIHAERELLVVIPIGCLLPSNTLPLLSPIRLLTHLIYLGSEKTHR